MSKLANGIDSMIAQIAPSWGLKRAKARKSLAYEAAVSSRLRGYNVRDSAPNDYTEARDRLEIIRQARDLQQNFGLFASIVRKLSIYALARVRYRAHTGDRALNRDIDAYIKDRSVKCDVSGRFDLDEIARMSLSEALVPGDVFCVFRKDGDETKPQIIESDRVGGNMQSVTKDDEVAGVKFDPGTGRVIEYVVYDRTTGGAYVNKRNIPADTMVQIMDPERYDRYRGISPFAPVINTMRDLKEVMEACLVGVKFNEYHAGAVIGGSGVPNDPSSYFAPGSDRTSGGEREIETKMHPGMLNYYPEGYQAVFHKSERPSGQFQSYLELLIRTIANAVCLPYGFVYSLSGLGGPSSRMDAAQAQRVIEYWQGMIEQRLLLPVSRRWILDGIASGDIPYRAGTRMFSGQWQFPPHITIDVGRESDAGINEIRAGLRSRHDWWDEEGKDAGEEMEVIADEARDIIDRAKKLSEETGVSIERCLDMLDMRNPNGTQPMETPGGGVDGDD